MDGIEQLYSLRRPVETQHFLEANADLIPLLEDAHVHLKKYFKDAEIFLEVVADPDVADERQLVIFISVEQNPEEAARALDRFDEDWWFDTMEKVGDTLCITLEFR